MKLTKKLMGISLAAAALHAGTAGAGQINVNADIWTVTNSSLTSRVGINTPSPLATLDLRTIAFANNQSGGVQLACTDGHFPSGMYLRTDSSGIPRLAFDIGSQELMSLNNSSGNVGIGTTYPTGGRLQVNAAGSVNGIYSQLSADGSGDVSAAAVEGIYSGNGTYGALGYASYPNGEFPAYYGVYGYSSSGYAGYFDGDVQVNGALSSSRAYLGQLQVEGNISGDFSSPVALIQNNNAGSSTSPALRVVGWGNNPNGALSVSANGTGLIAQFGNYNAFVADIRTNGIIDAVSFNTTSDRNAKENFAAVSPATVLEKVVALPISKWNFKHDTLISHIGPMAQDFYAAFQVGTDDKHIATVDEEGVALAAIQGLNQKVESENATLRAENSELKKRLEKLEQLINRRLTSDR